MGKPEQAKATGALNVFSGETVTSATASPPDAAIVIDPGLIATPKAGKLMVEATDATPLLINRTIAIALIVYTVEEVVGVDSLVTRQDKDTGDRDPPRRAVKARGFGNKGTDARKATFNAGSENLPTSSPAAPLATHSSGRFHVRVRVSHSRL